MRAVGFDPCPNVTYEQPMQAGYLMRYHPDCLYVREEGWCPTPVRCSLCNECVADTLEFAWHMMQHHPAEFAKWERSGGG